MPEPLLDPLMTVATAGLGIHVAQLFDAESSGQRGTVVVLEVIADSPADRGGLQPGDRITQIDGESVTGKSFADVVSQNLRGPAGTQVHLLVQRAAHSAPLQIQIERSAPVH